MREFTPGYGPSLGGEGNTRLEGHRATTNAAGVAPAAAANAEIFAVGELVNFRTRTADEQVRATVTLTRQNADMAGSGTYRFRVDAVTNGQARNGPTGTDLESFTMDAILTIAVAGAHTLGVNVGANVGTETVSALAILDVVANEFPAA